MYGANSWKVHNFLLEEDAKALEKSLEALKDQSTDINRSRKNAQVSAKPSSFRSLFTLPPSVDYRWRPAYCTREQMDRAHFAQLAN